MNTLRLLFLSLLCSSIVQSQTPTQQVTGYTITDHRAWRIGFSISVPTTSDSAIALVSTKPIASISLANKVYRKSEWVNTDIKVLEKFSKGTKSFVYRGLPANTKYYFAFISFNNTSGSPSYRTTDPLIVHTTTKGRDYGDYYKGLDTNRAVFLSKLAELLQKRVHNSTWYTEFRQVVGEAYERDTFIGDSSKKYVICDYSDIIATYIGSYQFPATKMNREHTLPKNWMNFRGYKNDSLTEFPEGSDYHNLTPTNDATNAARQDYAFGPVTSNIVYYGKAKLNNSSTISQRRFEPQDRYKGNVARCVFYTQLCYNGIMSKTWGLRKDLKSDAQNQDQEILKTWARADTPDNAEIARNECIYAYQENRNPFIDFPSWIDCIDFNDMKQLKTCQGLYISDTSKPKDSTPVSILTASTPWDVWYYPYQSDRYILKYYLQTIEPLSLKIYALNGSLVSEQLFTGNAGENSEWMDISMLTKGVYIIHISTPTLRKSLKLTKE